MVYYSDLNDVSPLYAPGIFIGWLLLTLSMVTDSIAAAFARKQTLPKPRSSSSYRLLREIIFLDPTVLASLSYTIIASADVLLQLRKQRRSSIFPTEQTRASLTAPGLVCYTAACILPICWFALHVISRLAHGGSIIRGVKESLTGTGKKDAETDRKLATIAGVGFLVFIVRCTVCNDASVLPTAWLRRSSPRDELHSHLVCSTIPTDEELKIRGRALLIMLSTSVAFMGLVSLLNFLFACDASSEDGEGQQCEKSGVMKWLGKLAELVMKLATKCLAVSLWATVLMGCCEFMLPGVCFLMYEMWMEPFIPTSTRKISDADQILMIAMSACYLTYSVFSCFVEGIEMKRKRKKTG